MAAAWRNAIARRRLGPKRLEPPRRQGAKLAADIDIVPVPTKVGTHGAVDTGLRR
jgi:hypothetical protein